MSEAFVTGSCVYGEPSPTSDVDLVVRCDEATRRLLHFLLAPPGTPDWCAAFRCGRLNLLVMTTNEKFDAWRKATDALIAKKPVSRDEAVALIAEKCKENGVRNVAYALEMARAPRSEAAE